MSERSPRERFVEAASQINDVIGFVYRPSLRAAVVAFADESHDCRCAFGRECSLSTCRTEYRAALLRECGLEVSP